MPHFPFGRRSCDDWRAACAGHRAAFPVRRAVVGRITSDLICGSRSRQRGPRRASCGGRIGLNLRVCSAAVGVIRYLACLNGGKSEQAHTVIWGAGGACITGGTRSKPLQQGLDPGQSAVNSRFAAERVIVIAGHGCRCIDDDRYIHLLRRTALHSCSCNRIKSEAVRGILAPEGQHSDEERRNGRLLGDLDDVIARYTGSDERNAAGIYQGSACYAPECGLDCGVGQISIGVGSMSIEWS